MAEGDDEKLVGQVVKEIAGAVKKAAASRVKSGGLTLPHGNPTQALKIMTIS